MAASIKNLVRLIDSVNKQGFKYAAVHLTHHMNNFRMADVNACRGKSSAATLEYAAKNRLSNNTDPRYKEENEKTAAFYMRAAHIMKHL